MSTIGNLAAAAALLASIGCSHESNRPLTPANGTGETSQPTAPDVAPSGTDAPKPTPNGDSPIPNNDSRSGTMPGDPARGIDDSVPAPDPAPGTAPHQGTGAPATGTNGAPVGGIH